MPTTDRVVYIAVATTLRAQCGTSAPTLCIATVASHRVEASSNTIRLTPTLAEIVDQNAAEFDCAMEIHQNNCATN